MFKQIWFWVFLFSLGVSLLISLVSYIKSKQISLPLGTVRLARGEGSFRILVVSILGRALAVFVFVYAPLIEQPRISDTIILPVIGIIFVLFGIVLVVVAAKELSKTKFHGGRGIPERIITTGPYGIIRHPAYVGSIGIFAGWSLFWAAVYSLCLLLILIIALTIGVRWEERNLEKALGDEYKEYKKKVGMFFPKIGGK